MATISPNVIGLYFIKRIEIDVQKAELSLVGLFQSRPFAGFPTAPLEMTVFAMVNGGRGDGVLQLAVYSLSTMEEYDLGNDWIYRNRRWIKFPDDPNFTITLELRLKNLIFFEAGEYSFVLTFDGKPVAERRMSVRQQEVK